MVNEVEFQNIKDVLLLYEMEVKKYQDYSEVAEDPYIKQFFNKLATTATQNKQQLMQFLQ